MVYAIFTFIALGIAGGYFFLGLEHKDPVSYTHLTLPTTSRV